MSAIEINQTLVRNYYKTFKSVPNLLCKGSEILNVGCGYWSKKGKKKPKGVLDSCNKDFWTVLGWKGNLRVSHGIGIHQFTQWLTSMRVFRYGDWLAALEDTAEIFSWCGSGHSVCSNLRLSSVKLFALHYLSSTAASTIVHLEVHLKCSCLILTVGS